MQKTYQKNCTTSCRNIPYTCILQSFVQKNVHEKLHENSMHKLGWISCRNKCTKSCRTITCTCVVQKNIHEIEQKLQKILSSWALQNFLHEKLQKTLCTGFLNIVHKNVHEELQKNSVRITLYNIVQKNVHEKVQKNSLHDFCWILCKKECTNGRRTIPCTCKYCAE